MGWIKRNLIFVIIGVVALGALGGAGFYIFTSYGTNAEATTALNENYDKLNLLLQQTPSPGNEKIDNTEIAKAQAAQLSEWITKASSSFQPVNPVPSSSPTIATFLGALQNTIDQLQHEADAQGVGLPPKFQFSFAAEKDKFDVNAAYLPQLAQQLGEVKAIAEIFFTARVNNLDGIQRVRITDQDAAAQGDYIEEHPVTNSLAIVTPYVVTFRGFTPELARVLNGLARSPNAFVVKSINVQPAAASSSSNLAGPMSMSPEGMAPGMPGYGAMPGTPAQPTTGKGGLQTVLKEQLLRVTMEVELIKLLPKS
jgi:hypothetical protein